MMVDEETLLGDQSAPTLAVSAVEEAELLGDEEAPDTTPPVPVASSTQRAEVVSSRDAEKKEDHGDVGQD